MSPLRRFGLARQLARQLPLVLLAAGSLTPALAQTPPPTDLWLLELPDVATAPHGIGPPDPVNLTDRAGYDNQPHITPDGAAVLYTSSRDGQTDIYRYDFAERTHTQVTATPESEYSPTIMPGGDRFSVIRVEADGTQRLWSFRLDGTDPQLVLEQIAPVGYHAWADANSVALFVLGTPPTLQLADLRLGTADTLAADIGRSLLPLPAPLTSARKAISFVQKTDDADAWTVRALEVDWGAVTVLASTLPGREDLAWLPDGTLLMADGPAIYYRQPGQTKWEVLAAFDLAGLGSITRLAVHPDGTRLVFVADRPQTDVGSDG